MANSITAKYTFGECVHVDGEHEIPCIITGIMLRRDDAVQYELSYFFNGDLKTIWVAEWRLSS